MADLEGGDDMTDEQKATVKNALDVIYGVGRVLTSDQPAPDTLSSLGRQLMDAAVALKEATGVE